jgi:hypothetical protein
MLFIKYYYDNQIKDDEMVGACRTYETGTEMSAKYWSGDLNGWDYLQDVDVDMGIILKRMVRKCDGRV